MHLTDVQHGQQRAAHRVVVLAQGALHQHQAGRRDKPSREEGEQFKSEMSRVTSYMLGGTFQMSD